MEEEEEVAEMAMMGLLSHGKAARKSLERTKARSASVGLEVEAEAVAAAEAEIGENACVAALTTSSTIGSGTVSIRFSTFSSAMLILSISFPLISTSLQASLTSSSVRLALSSPALPPVLLSCSIFNNLPISYLARFCIISLLEIDSFDVTMPEGSSPG
jgi:hypothetical protein